MKRAVLYVALATICFQMGRMCFTYKLCWVDWLGQDVCAPIVAMAGEQ